MVSEALSVVHVVATDGHRGAEVFASDLVAALAPAAGLHQTVAVLRASGRRGPRYEAEVHTLGTDGGPAWGRVLGLRRLVRARPGAVVQAHGGEALKHALAAAATVAAARVVYRRIGMAPAGILRGPRRAAHGALMRRASHVVAVSEAVREETIRTFGLAPGRIATIPNAVDPERLRPDRSRAETRAALGIPAEAVVVLSLGALSWEKDPLAALAVTAPLLRAGTAFHLFAGDGPLRAELEQQVRREGLGERARVLGSRPDVGTVLAASDLLVLASRADGMEGMPATVIEAGFAGLAVAAYGVAGVPEVVVDGVTGLVCRPGDRIALTGALADLAGDEARRRRLGEAASIRCRERYAIAEVAPLYIRLYERLVGAGPAYPVAPAGSETQADSP